MQSPLFMAGPVRIIFLNLMTECSAKWYKEYIELGDDEFKTFISLVDDNVTIRRTISGLQIYSPIGLVELVVDRKDLPKWHEICILYENESGKADKELMLEPETLVSGFNAGKSVAI